MSAKNSRDKEEISRKTSNTISRPFETNSISLDEAQEIVHIGSWQWNVASGDIIWSDELYRIYGLKPQEQSIGYEKFMELIYPDDREKVSNIINEAYQTKQSFNFEHRIVLPNKKIRILQGKGKVISDETGNVTAMLGTSQDITERKKSDLALHQSNERFNAVSAATSDVVYDIDLETGTVWFNGALNTEYKYPKRNSPYTVKWRLNRVHVDDRERIETSLGSLLQSEEVTWVSEYKFKRYDGTFIDVRDRAYVLRDAHKKPLRIIGSILDITQQKELERAKDRFISLVSHQLRTPLSSMRLLTELLTKGYTGEMTDTQQDYLQKIEASTIRMIRLVNEILGVSSLETGRLRINTERADINALIQIQIDEMSPLLAEKNITVKFTPDTSVRTLNVDPVLFSQIVHNLLANAVRYTLKKDAQITITCQKSKKEYLLAVTDQGIGIPKIAQPHIFSSFFRANNAIRTESDGSGLGLYFVKLILDTTGGKVWFESLEGKGSTFYISLPLEGMENSPSRASLI